jgi:hypothetical protein
MKTTQAGLDPFGMRTNFACSISYTMSAAELASEKAANEIMMMLLLKSAAGRYHQLGH